MKNIIELINQKKFLEAREELAKKNVVDIAALLSEIKDKELVVKIFRILPKDIAADVFSYMEHEQKLFIINSITDAEVANIINDLYIDDTVDFLEELPANMVKKILKNTDETTRAIINQFLNYPEHSAGSIMTIEYVDLKKEMTVEEALEHIRKTGVDKETINTCYVIDENRILEGIISIRKLILCDKNSIIKDIMKKDFIYVNTLDDQETVAKLFKKYDLISIPVTDNEKRLVGIITIDDIIDIIDQENTEDLQKMAAMAPSEEEYLKTSTLQLAKNRITWLLILMISATFTGNIIRKFEDVLQSVVILAAFIPMLMDTGGNAGSQSSTLIIRGLALGEIKSKDVLKVIKKELGVSLLTGIVLAFVNFIRLHFLEKTSLLISITVCISLFFTVVLAKVVGGILPIAAKKAKVDPAIMASPLITTIVDALALIIYFTTAKVLLKI
ncbi:MULTISPECIES: magnesium transporter [Caloramator]|uniref:Magnesium transporter MgtE n=1 Tax=Caloramator australicus RC3 TaxID=857293 RepID=I7K8X0_9CLOT|nr:MULTISPECIES: magnesium transporter [Caloramator]MDO6353746.1 magnesium transporter [Caloramator sp. CAR-1]CCJ34010.1 Magnesium transporter [Caloramator australicus RC3]